MVALGIEPGTSGSVAKNSEHYTTEAVTALERNLKVQFLYHRTIRSKRKYVFFKKLHSDNIIIEIFQTNR
jgi:hypothetical protein